MRVKQLGHERDHPSSSSSKVKKEDRYITLENAYPECREKNFNIWMMNQEELCRYQKFRQLTKRCTKQIPEPISSKVICIDYINLI